MKPPRALTLASTREASAGCVLGGGLASDTGGEEVREAARALVRDSTAAFQDASASAVMSPAELWSVWRDHLGALTGVQHTILYPVRLARISWLSHRYLAGRAAVFQARRAGAQGSAAEPLGALGRHALARSSRARASWPPNSSTPTAGCPATSFRPAWPTTTSPWRPPRGPPRRSAPATQIRRRRRVAPGS